MSEDATLFTEVDRTGDPDFFIRFLDQANANPDIQKSKPVILDALHLRPGLRVLDLGCGTGADVIDIAQRVAPSGTVTGVDASEAMIAEARRRCAGSSLSVTFEAGDATQLRFAANTFDACRTERMLMHIAQPDRAFGEMVRVTKPGGRVAVFDIDWGTFVIDHPDHATTRRVVASFSDSIRSGWIGRQLRRMFIDAGMTEVSFTCRQTLIDFEFLQLIIGGHLTRAQHSGMLRPDEVRKWWDYLHDFDADGRFLAGFTAFVVSGEKI